MSVKKITTINGIEVEYKVLHHFSNDFEIEITKPFQNITGGLHIPYFSRAYHNFDGDHGEECILSVLNNIYELGSHISENITCLKEQVHLLDQNIKKVSANSITEDEFKEISRKSRKMLRKNEISNSYHQKILRWWKKELDRVWLETEFHYIDPFFEENFPMCVPNDTRKQVLKILRGEISFKDEN